MKNFRSILPVTILLVFGATASLQAGPGVDYFKRVDSVSASAKTTRDTTAQTPATKCKVTEVVRVTTGAHGIPTHQVVSTNMDCSNCQDSAMPCCASKAKS